MDCSCLLLSPGVLWYGGGGWKGRRRRRRRRRMERGRILRAPAGLGVGGGEKLDAQSIPCAEA
jgi:hypothetical protein